MYRYIHMYIQSVAILSRATLAQAGSGPGRPAAARMWTGLAP